MKDKKVSIKPKDPPKEAPKDIPEAFKADTTVMVGDMNLLSDEEINFFMTWFPNKADYEEEITIMPDEAFPGMLRFNKNLAFNSDGSGSEFFGVGYDFAD